MVKLFTKPNDKRTFSPFLVINREFLEIYKMLLAGLVFLKFIQGASAETCFEINGHDYTLSCINNEKQIMSILTSDCGAYKDQGDDCARYFIDTLNFCKGVFGGSACTLDYHNIILPDECAVQKIAENCHDGYGTWQDIVATIGIVLGGLLALCCLTGYLMSVFRKPVNVVQVEMAEEDQAQTTPIAQSATTYGTTDQDNGNRAQGATAGEIAGTVAGAAVEIGLRAAIELPLAALSHCAVM